MSSNIPTPQKWWTLWQWIFALLIAPILTVLITNKLDIVIEEIGQTDIWESQEDSDCYLKNLGHLPVATPKGFTISSMTCPSGNTFIRIQTPDKKQKTEWISLKRLIPKYVIANDRYLFSKAVAQPTNTKNLPDLIEIAQNKQNTIICSKIIKDVMTYVIKKPNGQCFKEKINIKTGIVIESRQLSCYNASCN